MKRKAEDFYMNPVSHWDGEGLYAGSAVLITKGQHMMDKEHNCAQVKVQVLWSNLTVVEDLLCKSTPVKVFNVERSSE